MACVAAEAAWTRVCERFTRDAQVGGLPVATLFGALATAEPLILPAPAIPPERKGADAAAATDALPRAAPASAPAPRPAPATPAATIPPAARPVPTAAPAPSCGPPETMPLAIPGPKIPS